MTYSLNEIEAMARRASRGAGLPWGLAEEAGKAARWLATQNLPGPEELANALSCVDGVLYQDLAPEIADGIWCARSGALCPLALGAVLCDRADEIADGADFATGTILHPTMVVPFAAAVARIAEIQIELAWPGCIMNIARDGMSIAGENLLPAQVDSLTCRRLEPTAVMGFERASGRRVDSETWARLTAFAHRTYAPATEASRLAGAGAGLTDND